MPWQDPVNTAITFGMPSGARPGSLHLGYEASFRLVPSLMRRSSSGPGERHSRKRTVADKKMIEGDDGGAADSVLKCAASYLGGIVDSRLTHLV